MYYGQVGSKDNVNRDKGDDVLKKGNLIAFILFILLLLVGYFYSQHPILEEKALMSIFQT